jgi:hypothetical protein
VELNRITPALAVLLLAGLVLSGCAARKAYPGPTRSDSEIATVQGAVLPPVMTSATERLRVTAINGAQQVGDWSYRQMVAEVLPGEYDFRVQHERAGGGVLGLALPITQAEPPQTLRFNVRGGYQYVIHMNLRTGSYAVSETARNTPTPGWDAPMGAAQCVKSDGGRLDCAFRLYR